MPTIKHYTNYEEILEFLNSNPNWIAGFTNGEGSFTASLFLDKDAMWGVVPQCEFNITQSMTDVILLEALHGYFKNTGGVYARQNNVGTVSFRKISVLKNTIIPFFIQYPLLGRKSQEFERWIKLVEIISTKKHIGDTIQIRDAFLEFAYILKDLNASRFNPTKEMRLDIIINWLKTLTNKPSLEEKLDLIKKIRPCRIFKNAD